MSSFSYPWGKMRPKTWRKALKRQRDEIASLKVAATTAYQKVLEELEHKDEVLRQQIEFVDKVTTGGKYDSQIAEAHLTNYSHILRPSDRTEVSVRPAAGLLRKSRAKVHVTINAVMDIRRGVCPPSRNVGIDHAEVTNTTSELALALEQPTHPYPHSGDSAQVQKHRLFGSSETGEAALEAERQEQSEKIERQNAFVSFESAASECLEQTKESKISYDFSDPCDETKFPAELNSLYPKFRMTCNLAVSHDIAEMHEDDYKAWVIVVSFSDLPKEKQDVRLNDARKPYSDIKSYIKSGEHLIWGDIQREHARRAIWPWIRLRLEFVNTLMLNRVSDSFSEDDLDAFAKFDYMVEGQVSPEQRRQYAQIIDLLQWPKETSRRELILRANPAYDLELLYEYKSLLDYSSDAGPAKNIPEWRRKQELRPPSVGHALTRLYDKLDEFP